MFYTVRQLVFQHFWNFPILVFIDLNDYFLQ